MTHLLITGDTGTGNSSQKQVAHIMKSKLRNTPTKEACILLGDNIYEVGATHVKDKQFKEKFEDIYRSLKVPFYLLLGNHDWGNSIFPDGREMVQVEYTKHSTKWNMPSRYYHKVIGDCDVFFLDTNFEWMDESSIREQFNVMMDLIKTSQKRWKILCGHHTWRSVGGHGNAEKRLESFLRDLVTGCGQNIHLYMCGHDHCKGVIRLTLPKQTLHCVVIGTGGKSYDPDLFYPDNLGQDSELVFHSPHLGFCDLKSSSKHLHLTFYTPLQHKCVKEFDIYI